MSKYYKADDVIRKRAEDLADTSYWEYGNPKNVDEWIEVAEMEFKDLPTIEVSEDCISRANLRRSLARPLEINNADEMYWKGWHDCTVAVETRITDSPRAVPSRAEGEWKLTINDDYRCTACGLITSYYKANYCPNCGAKMKG